MPFPYFDLSRFDPGIAKRPTASVFSVVWTGTPPSARFEMDGWRANDSGRGYFPTTVTVPSEPRFSMSVGTYIFDLAALSFGRIFAGLCDTIPPTGANTALTGRMVGCSFLGDTDNFAERRCYPYMHNGTTEVTGQTGPTAGGKNIDADVGLNITMDFWMDASDVLHMRINGVDYVTSTGLTDMVGTWSYYVIGTTTTFTGTTGAADATVDFDLRTRWVDLRQMPVDIWNDTGSASPMVMG